MFIELSGANSLDGLSDVVYKLEQLEYLNLGIGEVRDSGGSRFPNQ